MFDHRNRRANGISEQLKKHFGDKMYRTRIPRNVRLAEAQAMVYRHCFMIKLIRCSSYIALAGEVIRREENPEAHYLRKEHL